MSAPRVLIEDWLPVAELGVESRRERAAASALPPLSFLHVWWARRPLVASAGTVLGSLLPAWTPDLAEEFDSEEACSDAEAYRAWFLRLCGILGDPIAARARIAAADEAGIKLGAKAYGYKQAFRNSPDSSDLAFLHRLLGTTWGAMPSICDPTAGGGAIPFEASRYGIPSYANDLNPVAATVLLASVELPARFGPDLTKDLKRWGAVLIERLRDRLIPFFELPDESSDSNTYIFAHTVLCPRTGKPVPLSPNWWLSKGSRPTAVRVTTQRDGQELDRCDFAIAQGRDIDFDPARGTLLRGDAISPWDELAIDGSYIKDEAQAGRMDSQLYAVAIRTPRGRGFREPLPIDDKCLQDAESEVAKRLADWVAQDVVPSEPIDSISNYDRGHRLYGIESWRAMFSPRQLLVHATFVEEFRKLIPEVRADLELDRADAVLTLLGVMQGKALNWNALQSSWNVQAESTRSVFDRHNFAFKWTFAEFEGARELFPWCLEQLLDAYSGLAELLQPADLGALDGKPALAPAHTSVTAANGADLPHISAGSVSLVCIDPPYYDNVMYAELADFFYVWEKRTLGILRPELFARELCDKQNEAVANLALFADMGKRRRELADADYEAKMAAIFTESDRVLRDDGVLTVMFTHKRAEAWDTLGMALMQAGFTIETSWPVNTEREHSLHQARVNAASSTIMLVCRKRPSQEPGGSRPYFEDLEGEVRAAARDALNRFVAAGIEGVDLLLATYGPALAVISEHWPVYSSEADPETGRSRLLRPEEALDAARAEVIRLQRQRLIGAPVALDRLTDFVLMAWDTFAAPEFPFDEARRLALAIGGLDVDELADARLVTRKAGIVALMAPSERVRRDQDGAAPGVRPAATQFSSVIDAVHTVMYVADEDGLPAAKAVIDRAGLGSDGRFRLSLQGLINAIPRTKKKGEWLVPEAGTLDRICSLYFPDIEIPPEPAVSVHGEQEEFELDA